MMNASNKQHQQPLNPFRTQPRSEDHHGALFENPMLQACYAVAVGALMVAVSVVAWTTLSQLPNPHEDSALAVGPHRIALTDLKLLNKPARMGGGVRSRSRIPPQQLADTTAGALFEKVAHVQPVVVNERSKENYDRDEDDSSKEDLLSFHHDDETEDTSEVHDLGELLLRPAEVHWKILGETKEQVKQEIDREEDNDHVFWLQQDVESTNSDKDDVTTGQQTHDEVSGVGESESANKDDARDSHDGHVLRRKGALETLLSADNDESITADKGLNATTIRSQSVIEIAADEADNQQFGEQADPLHEQAQGGPSSGGDEPEQLLLRRKRHPPIAITADE